MRVTAPGEEADERDRVDGFCRIEHGQRQAGDW
jgi:hypothetical protein